MFWSTSTSKYKVVNEAYPKLEPESTCQYNDPKINDQSQQEFLPEW